MQTDHSVTPSDRSRCGTQIYLFAVNHKREGESILRFSHELGTDVLTFEREFTHPLIRSPNAVMPDSLEYSFHTPLKAIPD